MWAHLSITDGVPGIERSTHGHARFHARFVRRGNFLRFLRFLRFLPVKRLFRRSYASNFLASSAR